MLLILAGVSIATLTGDNGILTNAGRAKTETEQQAAKEKVEIAVLASYDERGNLNYNTLRNNLKDLGVSESELPDPITKDDVPLTITVDGYEVKINEDGNVTTTGEYKGIGNKYKTPPTISILISETTSNSIKITVEASDAESGLATSGTYQYYLNDELKATTTESSYNYTELESDTSYTLKVIVVNGANNELSASVNCNTEVGKVYFIREGQLIDDFKWSYSGTSGAYGNGSGCYRLSYVPAYGQTRFYSSGGDNGTKRFVMEYEFVKPTDFQDWWTLGNFEYVSSYAMSALGTGIPNWKSVDIVFRREKNVGMVF